MLVDLLEWNARIEAARFPWRSIQVLSCGCFLEVPAYRDEEIGAVFTKSRDKRSNDEQDAHGMQRISTGIVPYKIRLLTM